MDIFDSLGLLSSVEVQRLQTTAWPFTVHLYISQPTDTFRLDHHVIDMMTPNSVGIGIDPRNHLVSVRVSKDSGIPTDVLVGVRKAGNPFFKGGDFVGGINAILSQAASERVVVRQEVYVPPRPQSEPVREIPSPQPVQEAYVAHPVRQPQEDAPTWVGSLMWTFFISIIIAGVWAIYRASRPSRGYRSDPDFIPYTPPARPYQPPVERMPTLDLGTTTADIRVPAPAPKPPAPTPAPVKRVREPTQSYSKKESRRREPTLSYSTHHEHSIGTSSDDDLIVPAVATAAVVTTMVLSDDDDSKKSSGTTSSWDEPSTPSFDWSDTGGGGGGFDGGGSSGSWD